MALRPSLQRISLTLGTGYILFFWSERVFWSFLRKEDEIVVFAGGWLIYSLFAYLLLATMQVFRVSDVSSLILSGAVFGWLLEGIYAMTLYGDPSMPFPFTIAWTALAWHGPISVVAGFYGMRRALQSASIWPSAAAAAGLGAFWGFWSSGWGAETPPVSATLAAFFIHAALATFGLALSQIALTFGQPERFVPTRLGLAIAGGPVLIFFLAVTLPALIWAPVVLVPLLALAGFCLRVNLKRSASTTALERLSDPLHYRNLAVLALLPVTATAVYGICSTLLPPLPAHLIVAAISGAGGGLVFLIACVRLLFAARPARGSATAKV